jgi:hypothetical protein
VPGSPYGNQAFCEVFPRWFSGNFSQLDDDITVQFWAQVGKPATYMPNYDDIYQVIEVLDVDHMFCSKLAMPAVGNQVVVCGSFILTPSVL